MPFVWSAEAYGKKAGVKRITASGPFSVRVLVDGIGDAQPKLYSIIPETSLHFVQEAPLHFQLGFGLSRGQFQPVNLDETQRTIKGMGKARAGFCRFVLYHCCVR